MTTLTATCDGSATGAAATDWGMKALPCNTTTGLTSWIDSEGKPHRACYHHFPSLLSRYPARYDSEIDGDGLSEAKRAREIVIEANDGYEVTVDEDDEWTNREGMPEFNGSFR